MTNAPLHFELPEKLSSKKLLAKLSKKFDVQIASQQHANKTFFDSFDWRLYDANIICEYIHSQSASY